ncbi:MAG: hypothetical protein ACD_29C00387G0001 [uncultured bacterium]|nr:MAG: hypothetical protein ACD_29C00387G0001 [uncultured bacterium]
MSVSARIFRSQLFVCIVLACTFLLSSCHGKNKSKHAQKTQIIIAKSETPVQRLYFTGTLSPIKTFAVVSPVAGNIASLDFTYGERIIAGQKLLVIDSKQLSDNYRKAVQDFLQKKQAYVTGKGTFAGTQALFNAGVIAKNEFITGQTQFDNQVLDYLQAKYALEKVLRTANIDSKKIEALSLADTDKVNAILETHFRHIEITAPNAGVALFPTGKKSDDSSSSGKLTVGDSIKDGQLLLSIGDLSGLAATFDVSEVDIDRIHQNMDVIVSGNAFPGAHLKGYISAVSVQANLNSGESGLSMFSVKIDIPSVDKKIMEKIRVGMTAKFEVDIQSSPRIMLPVNAVFEKNGQSMVTIMDAQGKQKTVPVITGDTTPTQVVIISGVKAGDKVVIP